MSRLHRCGSRDHLKQNSWSVSTWLSPWKTTDHTSFWLLTFVLHVSVFALALCVFELRRCRWTKNLFFPRIGHVALDDKNRSNGRIYSLCELQYDVHLRWWLERHYSWCWCRVIRTSPNQKKIDRNIHMLELLRSDEREVIMLMNIVMI